MYQCRMYKYIREVSWVYCGFRQHNHCTLSRLWVNHNKYYLSFVYNIKFLIIWYLFSIGLRRLCSTVHIASFCLFTTLFSFWWHKSYKYMYVQRRFIMRMFLNGVINALINGIMNYVKNNIQHCITSCVKYSIMNMNRLSYTYVEESIPIPIGTRWTNI